ncbi:unnamed protein product [Coregonus sp. 'balchen']|nr:unnamed protein product [Coregonus sp. 'balchen']
MLTLGCIATGFTPASLTFKWKDTDENALTDFVQYPVVQTGEKYMGVSQLLVKRSDWDEKKTFQCAVEHSAGSKEVILQKPARDFSPKDHEITWLKNNKPIAKGVTNFCQDEKKGEQNTLYSATSFLSVGETEWTDGSEYTCRFVHKSGNQTKTVKYSSGAVCDTHVEFQFIEPTPENLFLDEKVPLECRVTSKQAGFQTIKWMTEDKKILHEEYDEREGRSITAKILISYEEWRNGTTFICSVEHKDLPSPEEESYRRQNEETSSGMVTLTCYVKDFYPKVVLVAWLVNDELVTMDSTKYQYNTTSAIETGRTYYSVYGQLTMSMDDWMVDVQRVIPPKITLNPLWEEVEGGSKVGLLCILSGFYPDELSVEWLLDGKALTNSPVQRKLQSVEVEEKTFSLSSQLELDRSQWTQGSEVTCKATHNAAQGPPPGPPVSRTTSICSAFHSSTPSIHLETPRFRTVMTQTEVTATCVVHSAYDAKVTWLLDGKDPTSRTPVNQASSTTQSISMQRVIPPKITLNPLWEEVEGGSKVGLLCILSGFYPDELSVEWLLDGKALTNSPVQRKLQSVEGEEKTFSLSSQLELDRSQWTQGSEVTCKATHNAAQGPPPGPPVSRTTSICSAFHSSTPSIHLETPRFRTVMTQTEVTATCVVHSAYDAKVTWLLDGKDPTSRTPVNQASSTTQSISMQRVIPPKITLNPLWEEVEGGSKVGLLCILSGFYPDELSVEWLLDGKALTNSPVQRKLQSVEGEEKTFSLSSQLELDRSQWTQGSEVTCKATHNAAQGPPPGPPVSRTTSICSAFHSSTPSIHLETPRFRTVMTQTEVTATCVVHSAYDAKVTWLLDGKDPTSRTPVNQASSTTQSISMQRVIPPKITLNPLWEEVEGGSKVGLLCILSGFYPDELSVEWLLDGKALTNSPVQRKLQSVEGEEKTFSLSSQLELDRSQWTQGSEVTCKATHNAAQGPPPGPPVSRTTSICSAFHSSTPSIHLETPRFKTVMTQTEVTATCVVHSAYDAKVTWLLDGKDPTSRTPVNQASSTTQSISRPAVSSTPTVLIRRSLPDLLNGDSAVLECAITNLSSSDLYVTFQANGVDFPEKQYVDLPASKDHHSLTRRFSVPTSHWKTDSTFTCKVNQGFSNSWVSNSTGKLFGEPSMELLLVPSEETSGSGTQKLICSGWGFNPQIKWLSGFEQRSAAAYEIMMGEDERVAVTSHITVTQQEWNQGKDFTCEVIDKYLQKEELQKVRKSINRCAVTPISSQKVGVYLQGPTLRKLSTDGQVPVTCLLVGPSLEDFSVSWKVDGVVASQGGVRWAPKDHSNGTQTVQIMFNVSARDWHAHKRVLCEVKHRCSSQAQEEHITKCRDPKPPSIKIVRPSDSDLWGSNNATLLCLVSGFFPSDVIVNWEKAGSRLPLSHYSTSPSVLYAGRSTYAMNSRLIVPRSEWNQDSNYSCVVRHESSERPITSTIANVFASVTHSAPTATLLQGPSELVCLVFGFSPSHINITWLLDDITELWNHNTSTPYRAPGGKFIIRSHLSLAPQDWAPGAVYTCRVTHTTQTLALNISKPVELLEVEGVFFDENRSDPILADTAEENWNMACIFLVLFLISLLYSITVTLVKTAMAENQCSDAVAGTESQHVANRRAMGLATGERRAQCPAGCPSRRVSLSDHLSLSI